MKAIPLFLTLVTLGLAACAGPERRDDSRRADPRLATAPSAEDERAARRDCMRESGSRVPRREAECIPVPGQVLTGEDLLRTGAPDLGSALRRATPFVR